MSDSINENSETISTSAETLNDEQSNQTNINQENSDKNTEDKKTETPENPNDFNPFQEGASFPDSQDNQQNSNEISQTEKSDSNSFNPFGEGDNTFTFDFPNNNDDGKEDNAGFNFSFDNFPTGESTETSFTFDANDDSSTKAEEDKLYNKFIELISNPCFKYVGKPLEELFKQDDPTDSSEAALALLVGEKIQ